MNSRQKEIIQRELNSENQTIKELRQVYQKALDDCNNKIRELSMRTDMVNIQSIVYQKKYQEAIKGQLENILNNLHTTTYDKVSDYLEKCYYDGFVGNMYDLAGQGIPLIVPINQNQVTKAIQIDSKLSKSLYGSLGENVNYLKTYVRGQISRGIASGMTWNEVADNLAKNMQNTPFQKALSNATRIVRTEGHRVQTAAKLDSMNSAKEKGADIVKQWDSTLDGKTRETHRKLDGQIRELDEDFTVDGMSASAPGYFGDPAEDCNCRCAVLQRARWALDKAELDTLKEDAIEAGIDDSKNLEQFQNRYLEATQNADGADSGSVRSDAQKINDDVSYRTVTEDWFENATPNSHEVEELNEYTVNGITYKVDGINVKQNNSKRELEIAELLKSTFGGEIYLVPEVNGKYKGVNTPDYSFRGKKYDLKEISSSKEDAIRNAIHKKKKQADNFIIDVTKSDMTQEQIDAQIEMVFSSYNTEFVHSLLIIDGDKIIKIVERK